MATGDAGLLVSPDRPSIPEQAPPPAVSAAEMAAVDEFAIDRGLQLLQMMENAGALLARLVHLHQPAHSCIVVLAGSGGNGGGALVAARRLAGFGHAVAVIPAVATATFTATTAYQWHLLERIAGVSLWPERSPGEGLPQDWAHCAAIVDGMLGYSVRGAPRGAVAEWIGLANRVPAPTIALDVPSGLNPDDGSRPGDTVHAMATLTLALPKLGLLTESARPCTGRLALGDIGIPPAWAALAVPRLCAGHWYSRGDLAWLSDPRE